MTDPLPPLAGGSFAYPNVPAGAGPHLPIRHGR